MDGSIFLFTPVGVKYTQLKLFSNVYDSSVGGTHRFKVPACACFEQLQKLLVRQITAFSTWLEYSVLLQVYHSFLPLELDQLSFLVR